MTKVLILGDTNSVTEGVRDEMLVHSKFDVVVYDQFIDSKMQVTAPGRETLIDGRLDDKDKLVQAMDGVDIVFLNSMMNRNETQTVVSAMKEAGVKRIVAATVVGIYGETGGDFSIWNMRKLGAAAIGRLRRAADVVERSGLDYTILRYTWIYEDIDNEKYVMVPMKQKFMLAQVPRGGVVKAVAEVLKNDGNYIRQNLGIGEPGTIQEKPDFYNISKDEDSDK